jgi:hypothetical protein
VSKVILTLVDLVLELAAGHLVGLLEDAKTLQLQLVTNLSRICGQLHWLSQLVQRCPER